MSISFTDITILVILLFGLFGLFRGGRYVALTTAAVFFAMALVATSSSVFLTAATRLGLKLANTADQQLFLAILFTLTIVLVQSSIGRIVPGLNLSRPKYRDLKRDAKLWGFLIGCLNGFLIVATIVHYSTPYLTLNLPARSGGWAFSLPTLQFQHPDSHTLALSIQQSTLVITPSPLLSLYENVPTALVLLFLLLAVVFIGSIYSRMNHLRS